MELHVMISRLLLTCVLLCLSPFIHKTFGKKVHVPGDIIIGGLVPIHQKSLKKDGKCGEINKDRGIQRLEAMLFAIDKINNDPNLLRNIKLGAIILDTCASDSYALNQSMEFIRASVNTIDASSFECKDGSQPKMKAVTKAITGVIGGSYSEVSVQVANLLRLFRIPQISPASTSISLSDKTRYDFFARTVPPDKHQANVLVDLVQKFNWSYVSLVASEGQYGDSGMTAFTKKARNKKICIAVSEKVPHSPTEESYDHIYKNLLSKPNARGVVLFTRAEDAKGILKAAKRHGENHLIWIGSDGWGTQEKLMEGLEDVAEGAITVELQSKEIEEFDWYMKNKTVYNNKRNPWFQEYWESVFSCKLPPNGLEENDTENVVCSPHLRLDESVGYKQESKVQFVVDAVYAFAHALHAVWTKLCKPRNESYCSEMEELDGGILYKDYLLKVSFIDLAESQVKFDSNGDGLPRYSIYNYQRKNNSNQFEYKWVGSWLNDELHISLENVSWNNATTTIPESFCSAPCEIGQVKVVQANDDCCWICKDCQPWEWVKDNLTCEDCGQGYWPYPDKSGCYPLRQKYIKWDSVFAVVPIGISCLGVILTVAAVVVFIIHNDTPIVKASGRELSYMLLGGILICFIMTFVLLAKPSAIICGLQRFGVGFGFSVIYGALLTKTNRIARIFDSARKSARRPNYITPKSQVIITLVLISVQVSATIIWFFIEPPGTRQVSPNDRRDEVILKCKIEDSSFLVSLLYNMVLITTCTIYAVITRKIPENFNESKFIGFTMYTTCIIWLAFVPIYFGTGNSFEIQITTLCVSISLSAYVALFCLFSPKIYIIIFHPDKNVRKLTMNSATYKKAPTSSTCGTSANHGSSVEQVKLTLQTTPSKEEKESDKDSLASL
ncbi:metabotropic glutamate receptor [Centruroides vittatus]|uniref:metabotropic glutamate receptor n=1 Tax=Centruroides vittatus TaxID=120091 RepID=UPI00350FC006